MNAIPVSAVFRVSPEPSGPGWELSRDGKSLGRFMIQHDAVVRAVVQAKTAAPCEVIVLKRDGTTESRRSYR